MANETNHGGEDVEIFEDYEEFVDLDEHERARAYLQRKTMHEMRERLRHDDYHDDFDYGAESGEALEEEDL